MSSYEWNFIAFNIIALIYSAFAIGCATKIKSVSDFFYNDNIELNTKSLVISNFTIGAGFIYPVFLGSSYGIAMVAIPVSIFFGYFSLNYLFDRVDKGRILVNENIFLCLDKELNKDKDKKYQYSKLPTISLVVVFMILLALDIFTSAKLLSPFLFSVSTGVSIGIISLLIFLFTLTYTLWGGILAVLKTDKYQLIAACFLVVGLLIISIKTGNVEKLSNFSLTFSSHTGWLVFIVGILSAIATQFYNVLNLGALARVKEGERSKLLIKTGAILASINLIIILSGVLFEVPEGKDILTALSDLLLSNKSILTYIVIVLFILGATSIIFSTVDSLIITISMLYHDNLKKDNDHNDLQELRSIRSFIFRTFTFLFLVLMWFNYYQPDILDVIFAITGGAVVYAPFVFLCVYLMSGKNKIAVLTPAVNRAFFIGFCLVVLANAVGIVIKQNWSEYIFIFALCSSFIYSLFLMNKSNKELL